MNVNISVLSTGDIDLDLLASTLEETVELSFEVDPSQFFYKSYDAPSFVTFVASLEEWQKALALGVLSSMAWEALKLLPKACQKLPPILGIFAFKVLTLQNMVGPTTEIYWGFPSENQHFPSQLKLAANDPVLLAKQLDFLTGKLSVLCDWLSTTDAKPMTGFHLYFSDDGKIIIHWFDDLLERECRHEL